MFKKLVSILAILFLCLGLSLSACERERYPLSEEFVTYEKSPKAVAEVLKLTEKELTDYTEENNIKLLAVNKDNTKQIKLIETVTDFSRETRNLTVLPDDKILELLPEITGMENVGGKIITENGQKLVKLELMANDDYYLTQFFTILDGKFILLSFYTDINTETDYIDQAYKGIVSSITGNSGIGVKIIILTLLTASGITCALIIFSIIKEFKLRRKST